MLGRHGSIVIPQNTPYTEEMRRHEAHYTEFGPPGRPFEYREFPKRMYRAIRLEKGGIDYEGFTVNDDLEVGNMTSRGYHLSQTLALAALEAEQAEHGKLAAEREYEIRHGRLSDKAAGEVRAAEAAYGSRHMPVVPQAPKKRGRPFKVTAPAE